MSNILTQLTDTETKILAMIRSMDVLDKLEIMYVKRGEICWKLIRSYKGVYNTSVDNDAS